MKSRILQSLKSIIDELTDHNNCGSHPHIKHKIGQSGKNSIMTHSITLSLAKQNNPNLQIIDFEANPNDGESLPKRYLNFNRDNASELMILTRYTNGYKRLSDRKIKGHTHKIHKQIADDFAQLTRTESIRQKSHQKRDSRVKKQFAYNPFLKNPGNLPKLDSKTKLEKNEHEKFISTLYEDLVASCEYSDLDHAPLPSQDFLRSKARSPDDRMTASALKEKPPLHLLANKQLYTLGKQINSSLKQSVNGTMRSFHRSHDQNIFQKSSSVNKRNLGSGQISTGSRSRSLKQPKSTDIDLRRQFENCRMMSTNSENVYTDLFQGQTTLQHRRVQMSSLFMSAEKHNYGNRHISRKGGSNVKQQKQVSYYPENKKESQRAITTKKQPEALFSNFDAKINRTVGSFRQMLKEKTVTKPLLQQQSALKPNNPIPKSKKNIPESNYLQRSKISPKKDSYKKVCLTSRRSLCNSHHTSNGMKTNEVLFEAYYLPASTVNETQNDSTGHLKSCKSSLTHHLNKSGAKLHEELMYNNSKKTFDKDGSARFTPKTILPSQLSTQILNENPSKKSRREVKVADLKRSISIEVRSREASIQKIFAKLKETNNPFKPQSNKLKEKTQKYSESDQKTRVSDIFKFPLSIQSKFPTSLTPFSFIVKPLQNTTRTRKSTTSGTNFFGVKALRQQPNEIFASQTSAKNPHLEYLVDLKAETNKQDCPYLSTEEFLVNPSQFDARLDRTNDYTFDGKSVNQLHPVSEVPRAQNKSDHNRVSTEKIASKHSKCHTSAKSRLPSTKMTSSRLDSKISMASESKTVNEPINLKSTIESRMQSFLKKNPKKSHREGIIGRKNDKFFSGISASLMLKSRKQQLDSSTTDKDGVTSSSTLNHVNSFKFSNMQ